MPIFDIPTDRLTDLTDADLRELIARLCEAEREQQGGHRNEVRWGGSQTATDGGLDVVVESVGTFLLAAPLLRRDAGIQVKAAGLAAAAITEEMRYGGSLRPAISSLAAKSGAYLIASAGVNCSETMLQSRIAAMRDAVADDANGAALDLVFLDRNAISRWVSAHPSVAAWLRRRLALPILAGWQPFGRWSSTPEEETDDLICEEGLAFHIESREPINSLPEALDATRNLVREGKGAFRIAGLSGIGKSRIVQALFEPVGDVAALPASHAIYTDLGHSPDPAPMGMLDALIERNAPAILVVDNCPPDTHQALARKVAQRSCPVRLITVEYDVRADRPEETDVIRIKAEGTGIVSALLRRRYRNFSSNDIRRLAELAQGNARLAFALAQAAPQTGTLSAFEDSVLFDRLFWQREERNDELARAAEVLSLVYSFEVDGEEEPDELAFLGSLVDLSRGVMHRHAATFLDRELAQARGKWRAVLPHALANRLARQALRSLSWRSIANGFANKQRLRRSLARRLSYLHDSEEAIRIVTRWMEDGGPLHGPTLDMQVLEAVCHLAPTEALLIIDGMTATIRAGAREFHHIDNLTRMILKTSHSEATFPRACESLMTLANVIEEQRTSQAGDALRSLFGLYFSGTLAQTETRTRVARACLESNDPRRNARGIRMLRSALQTGGWSSSVSDDDARPDAFGWEPDGQDVIEWFTCWLDLSAQIALSGPAANRDSVRKAIADQIDGIWRRLPTLRSRIIEIALQLHEAEPWAEGRHALRNMLHYIRRRGEEFPEADTGHVMRLIDRMEPMDLEARVRAEMVMGWDYEIEDEDFDTAAARRAQRLELLGQELAANPNSLRAVGRDLLETEGSSFYPLGTGLARGSDAPVNIWVILRDLYLIDPASTRQIGILSGFIQQLDISGSAVAYEIRDECRATPALRREYDLFLPRGVLPDQDLEHVIEIAGEPETLAWKFCDLAWRPERELSDENRVRLLRAVLAKTGGPIQVVKALTMLRHFETEARSRWPEELRELGLDAIVEIIRAGETNPEMQESVSRALSACLRGDDGSGATRVMDAIMDHVARRYGSTFDVQRTLATLAEHAPATFLAGAFSTGANSPPLRSRVGRTLGLLSHVPIGTLIEWCMQDPNRWTRVTSHISPFSRGIDDEGEAGQITPFAVEFFEASPRPGDVVEAYLQHLSPMSWSGSLADIMERRLVLIETIQNHPTTEVRRTLARLTPGIRAQIDRIRQTEQEEDSQRDQSFE